MNRNEAKAFFAEYREATFHGPNALSEGASNRDHTRAARLLAQQDPRYGEARQTLREYRGAVRYFRGLHRDVRELVAQDETVFSREYLAAERVSSDYEQAQAVLLRDASATRDDRRAGRGRPMPDPIVRASAAAIEPPVAEASEDRVTKAEQTIRWAYDAMDGYRSVLRILGSKRIKQQAVGEFMRATMEHLVDDPEMLETAFGIWKAVAEESGSGFYRAARQRVADAVGSKWEGVPADRLAYVITKFSRNGYVSGVFEDYLKGYFSGPKSMEGRVESFYRFADASMDTVDDPEALRVAALIGNFETDILPRGGDTFQDMHIMLYAQSLEKDMYRKGNIALRMVISDITRVAGFDRDVMMQRNYGAMTRLSQTSTGLHAKIKRVMEDSAPANRSDGAEPRTFENQYGTDLGPASTSVEMYARIARGDVELDDQELNAIEIDISVFLADPVGQKAYNRIIGRANSVEQRAYAELEIRSTGEEPIHITRQVGGCMIEIAIPASFVGDRRAILETFLADTESIEQATTSEIPIVPVQYEKDGKMVYGYYRKLDESEAARRHPLEALVNIGFPQVDAENLQGLNAALADQLVLEQRRFMTPRGIGIPLTHPELRSFGYHSINFKKNAEDKSVIDATTRVRGQEITVKLDEDFRFDYEGLPVDAPDVVDSLHNVMLRILHPALCNTTIVDEEGHETEANKAFVDRAGYIGYVAVGKSYSEDAVTNLLKHEGKDLRTRSEQRKAIDPTGQGRASTYTRPVESNNPHLPPVQINIGLPRDTFKTYASISLEETAVYVADEVGADTLEEGLQFDIPDERSVEGFSLPAGEELSEPVQDEFPRRRGDRDID